MKNKKSLFDRMKLDQSIKAELLPIKKSLVEDLVSGEVTNFFRDAGNLGMKSSGERIRPEDVAAEDDYEIVGTVNGVTVRRNKKTNELNIVAADTANVSVTSEADAKKLADLATIAKRSDDAAKPEVQVKTDAQDKAREETVERQRREQGVFEGMFLGLDNMEREMLGNNPFMNGASQDDTEKKLGEESDEKEEGESDEESEEEESEEEESEEGESNSYEDGSYTVDATPKEEPKEGEVEKKPITVVVAPAGDSLTTQDPMDTVTNFNNWKQTYDYPPDEMPAQVRAAHLRAGMPTVPNVSIDPQVGFPGGQGITPQTVRGINPGTMDIKEPLPDSLGLDMGNSVSLKLSLELGK